MRLVQPVTQPVSTSTVVGDKDRLLNKWVDWTMIHPINPHNSLPPLPRPDLPQSPPTHPTPSHWVIKLCSRSRSLCQLVQVGDKDRLLNKWCRSYLAFGSLTQGPFLQQNCLRTCMSIFMQLWKSGKGNNQGHMQKYHIRAPVKEPVVHVGVQWTVETTK